LKPRSPAKKTSFGRRCGAGGSAAGAAAGAAADAASVGAAAAASAGAAAARLAMGVAAAASAASRSARFQKVGGFHGGMTRSLPRSKHGVGAAGSPRCRA